ncbi:MAG: hypothetical protein ACTSWW_12565, partial [Promethearchaeota archaeon]
MSIFSMDWAWPWWTAMVIISIVNLVLMAVVYKKSLISKDDTETPDTRNTTYRNRMRIMGLIFTVVAAYRTVFVSRYDPQLAWFDSIANSSLLIRAFAAAAELSFSGLIAFAMLQFNIDLPASKDERSTKFKIFLTTKTPYVLISSIFIAQFFAFGGVIFKSDLFWAIEETLWSVGFIAILPLSIIQLRRVLAIEDKETLHRLKMLKHSAIVILAWCVIYCSYGLFFHIFGLWESAIIELKTGFPATGPNALADAFLIVHESKVYSDWGFGFLFWHSAY